MMCDSVLFTIVSLKGIYAWAWSIILQAGLWPCEWFGLKKLEVGLHMPHWFILFFIEFIN